MSSTKLLPFIKWGSYKSQDPNKPDLLQLKVVEDNTFLTAYSTNTRVAQEINGTWNDVILPLKYNDSLNSGLYKEWIKLKSKGLIKHGRRFILKTWLGQSKFGRPIRRFDLDF